LYSQKNAIDTIYFENGSVNRIGYSNDEKYSGYPVDVYYRYSEKEIGKKIFDTVYFHSRSTEFNYTRQFLDEESIIIRKYLKDKNFSKNGYSLQGIRLQYYLDFKNFYIQYWYYTDSTISAIMIGVVDTISQLEKKQLVDIRFEKGSSIKPKSNFYLGEYGTLNINYNHNNFASRIIINYKKLNKEINFYTNGQVNETGLNDSTGRIDYWYEYYLNGSIKSIGKYAGSQINGFYMPEYDESKWESQNTNKVSIIHFKDDFWKYFNEVGVLIKEEHWEKGKLINTIEY
jgi:hypothetical protein